MVLQLRVEPCHEAPSDRIRCWITVSNMRNDIRLLLLFYSDMYRVFIPVGPLPLSSAPALVPGFALPKELNLCLCPAESPPQAHFSWVAPAIPIATMASGAQGQIQHKMPTEGFTTVFTGKDNS
jgi:hypothetical protein